MVTKLVREARSQYFQGKLETDERNPKVTWSVINSVLGRTSDSSSVGRLTVGQETVTDPALIAAAFNDYFSNIGAKLASEFDSARDFMQHMSVFNNYEFKFDPVTVEYMISLVSSMKSSGAGYDEIPMNIFKDNLQTLAPIITFICNSSLTSGVFPARLAKAKVTCVYKSGDPTLVSNYRPISVLPAFSKILEKVVYIQLNNYFVQNNLFSSSQFGFRGNLSTETAVHEIADILYSDFDSGRFGLGVFLDLSKAFDSLDRSILLEKLRCYGLNDSALRWFVSYFCARKQYTVIDKVSSDTLPVFYGIPQGSILGPLLFIIFVNDIVKVSSVVRFILYADDTSVLLSSSNLEQLFRSMNTELVSISRWFTNNKLTINTNKSHYVIFHRKQRPVPEISSSILVDGKVVERTFQVKFLGVQLDEHLDWRKHTGHIIRKLAKYVPILYRIRNNLTEKSLKLIYNSLIYPNLIYCNSVWGACASGSLNSVFLLQKKIVRAIAGVRAREHTAPLFHSLCLLRITTINLYMSCVYIFRSLLGINICDWFVRYECLYDTRLSSANTLVVPFVRSSHSRQSIRYNGVQVWNSLPNHIREIEDYNLFKITLKKHLLSQERA